MEKWLKRFVVVFILSLLTIAVIYYYIPTDLNITNTNKAIITIESGGSEIQMTNEQKQELIGVLQKVEFYRGASSTRFQSGPSANSVITLTGDYNKSYNFVHLYILENEPNRSFAQLSTETKYRMKSEDVDKIILFLHAVK